MIEKSCQTLAEMIVQSTQKYSDNILYGYKENKVWKTIDYSNGWKRIVKIGNGLRHLGLKKGDHVSIVSENSLWWALSDYATLCVRGILTTIYPTLTAKQIKWILLHSESKYLFCENKKQAKKILSNISHLHNINKIIMMDNSKIDNEKFITIEELMNYGIEYKKKHPTEFDDNIKKIKKDDVFTLIYTSGTTGEPKGVMLTHENMISNLLGAVNALEITEKDTLLSFLPLSHSFERMAGHFLPVFVGAQIWHAENILKVAENIREVKPTLMVSVPRLYERIYTKIISNVEADSVVKRKIFWWAVNTGKKMLDRKLHNKKIGLLLSQNLKIAEKLVYSKIREKVGGKLKFFISGGAPLPKEIGEFFNAIGVIILEGYGLTETSPVITVNLLEKNKIGTVGKPLFNVSVDIAHDGEILMKGTNLMKGYYKEEAATQELIDRDGWFHTGDIGELDEDGFLKITDRKRNIIVTAGGKNIAPQPIENVLSTSKWIDQVVIIGDRRKYLTALVVPSFPNLEEWAKNNGLKWNSVGELVKLQEVKKIYDQTILESMEGFAQFEKVRKYKLLTEEFTIENGELTPSLKIRRKIVMENYSGLIDSLYNGGN